MQAHVNGGALRTVDYHGRFDRRDYEDVARFYERHPELCPTPLTPLPGLAARLSLAGIWVKDETERFGLEAFKIAGARYAMERLGAARLGGGVMCATAGNHGRAVARASRDLGVPCTVFVPAVHQRATALERRTRAARIAGMQRDGAATIDVPGSYEEAVACAAERARRADATIVSDTSWPGYEDIPRLIMAGYTRLFDEASRQWSAPPDVVLVQGGVGGLVCAAANWFAHRYGASRPYLIACEPDSAACLLASARAGRAVDLTERPAALPSAGEVTMMAGLRCAAPSPAAWPSIHAGTDAFVSVPDALVLEAMRQLEQPAAGDRPIAAGPSGACGLAALAALLCAPELAPIRAASGLGRSTRAMVIVTEGP